LSVLLSLGQLSLENGELKDDLSELRLLLF
jgi:hypothetical protein